MMTWSNAFSFYEGTMHILLDIDFFSRDYFSPSLGHLGGEVEINKFFIFRAGIGQFILPENNKYQVLNSVTTGFGLIPLKDFNIDYAYYPGDEQGKDSMHLVGLSFDSFAMFTPPTGDIQEKISYDLKINNVNDFIVTTNSEILFDLIVNGYKKIRINNKDVSVINNKVNKKYLLKEGINKFEIIAGDRKILRRVLRLKSYPELVQSNEQYDISKVIFTKQINNISNTDNITLAEMAKYVVRSTGLKMPEKLGNIFNDLDIIYLKGYLGPKKVVDFSQSKAYITNEDLAMLLTRLEGYDYVFTGYEEKDWTMRAVETLTTTGKYTEEEFLPLKGFVSKRSALIKLAKTGKINQLIQKRYGQFPLYWIDLANKKYWIDQSIVAKIHFYNTERFKNVEVDFSGEKKVYKLLDSGLILFSKSMDTKGKYPLLINILDNYGNKYREDIDVVVDIRPKGFIDREDVDAESMFLIKTVPKMIYPGQEVEINIAVVADETYQKLKVNSLLLEQDKTLVNETEPLWSFIFKVPTNIDAGSYYLNFEAENYAGNKLAKRYRIEVQKFIDQEVEAPKVEDSKIPVTIENIKYLVKAKPEAVNIGDSLDVYVGVIENEELISDVSIVFENGEKLNAEKIDKNLWKAIMPISSAFKQGESSFKVFIKDANDKFRFSKHLFFINDDTQKKKLEDKPVLEEAVQAKSTMITSTKVLDAVKQNKIYYTADFIVIPEVAKKGEQVKIKIKNIDKRAAKVSLLAAGKKVELKEHKNYKYTYVTIPKNYQFKEYQLKLYLKDTTGKYSMTEKIITIK